MLACTALVGCTSEDAPVVDNGNENNGKEEAYMKVKLIMNDNIYSRATGDAGYQRGVADEQAINGDNSIFLFYDKDGNWVTSGVLIDESSFTDGDASDHEHGEGVETDVNSIYDDAYVVLEGPSEDLKNTITQVLTVINYSGAQELAAKKLDLEQALVEINETKDPSNGKAVENGKEAGFVMSTSVYYNTTDKKIVNTTKIVQGNICNTQAAALANPVKIYVERASAKVQLMSKNSVIKSALTGENAIEVVSKGENETESEGKADITIDGIEYPLWIQIDGWTINNVNTTSNLVKEISEDWLTNNPLVGEADWNQENDYRSYWAIGTKYDQTDGKGLTAYSYNQAITNLGALTNEAMYCYEQTVEKSNISPLRTAIVEYPNTPTILIAASILKESNNSKTTVGTIYKYGGVFYSEEEFKKLIIKKLEESHFIRAAVRTDENGKEIKVNADGKTIEPDAEGYAEAYKTYTYGAFSTDEIIISPKQNDLAKISVKIVLNNESVLVLKNATNEKTNPSFMGEEVTYDDENESWTEADNFINALSYVTGAEMYKEGKCYYQIPIEHLSSTGKIKETTDPETGAVLSREVEGEYLYGVVRNHWYKLNITSVANIGEPVGNPDQPIPVIPPYDTSYYMAAELHVLNWHVVEQDVTLD